MTRLRARQIGLGIGRFATGPHNALTDVAGVLVGHSTINYGEGRLRVGHGPARTGVTAILPRDGNVFDNPVAGGAFVLNGAGELSGLSQVNEWGIIETPIILTGTLSVGDCSAGVLKYMLDEYPQIGQAADVIIPVVGECDDSWLNDAGGRHVKGHHVDQAIRSASAGPVTEGSVGAGTGMMTCGFKSGIGTSSRRLHPDLGGYTTAVLALCNFGLMRDLRMAGIPVGQILAPSYGQHKTRGKPAGSIIAVAATDAPLTTHQLARLSKRVALGIGRCGSYAANASGEIVIAFSTANDIPRVADHIEFQVRVVHDQRIDPLFEATADATEEAVINSMCMADEMTGINGHHAPALPLDEVRDIVQRVTASWQP